MMVGFLRLTVIGSVLGTCIKRLHIYVCNVISWKLSMMKQRYQLTFVKHANNFCVKALSKVVAFDFQNENYNLYLKQTPVAPSLDLSIIRSGHVMCGVKARIEMEGLKCQRTQQLSRGASEEDNVFMLEGILAKCLIFDNH
jgi:hypothetical protein